VLANLKKDKETQTIPILVCSADDREETISACKLAGCAEYLVKPFSAEQFLEAVETILNAETPPLDTPSGPTIAA
jgi:CheY-like chemotaxis protein